MFNEDYRLQIGIKPLSFELYLNFLNEMFQSNEMNWFLNDIENVNLYGVLEENEIEEIESSFERVKEFYFSNIEEKRYEFSEYTDINNEHEQIVDLLLDIDRYIQNMINQLEENNILEECLIDNIENSLYLLEEKKNEIEDLKFKMDIHFKLVNYWDEDMYYNFINFFINKSDFKYFSSLVDELGQRLKNENFKQKELNLLTLIKDIVGVLITFYEQFHISSAYELGNNWFEIDRDIRMSLIFINEKITLIEYTYIEKGESEELLVLLEEIFNNYSTIINAIMIVYSENE
ncbi:MULTISPECIES: hypothetical protein [Staphylococcus]|uniref:hypothetical protein n=1 Tax=Staphylococcus TaxID=1279 RepID=UPI0004AFA157|nr:MULTISPECIES: hypothetical protein [Staphylococcus]EGQ1463037.1 hypothetical protein [Staphylococcus aureus]OFM10054.1 hypothetical protein HMPREF2720_03975 [Staphylococcus sp. HMSC074C02]OFO17163.1 hypothetical protein HMPREF3058_06140 [Staphylococcus sp. HMSC068G11]CXR87425.1 Uncharacterised protein [Staphylococcus aureus]CXX60325.1 Uncharacterised protein [Staphylococcus aureus]